MLNEAPNNIDIMHIANIMLKEVPNSNDATHVASNVRLTIMGTQQLSMVAILPSCRKADLPQTRDNDTITRSEAIMLLKLNIILFSNSYNFTYYSQNYVWFNAHDISDS